MLSFPTDAAVKWPDAGTRQHYVIAQLDRPRSCRRDGSGGGSVRRLCSEKCSGRRAAARHDAQGKEIS